MRTFFERAWNAWATELFFGGCVLVLCIVLLRRDTAELADARRPLALGIDEAAATDVLHFAWAVYCPKGDLLDWDCQWCDRVKNVSAIKVADHADMGTRAYVAYDAANNRLLVAVRGTVNNQNALEDLQPWFERFPPAPTAALVHHGFLDAYRSLHHDIQHSIQKGLVQCPSCSVLFTGHSLGAAVATLAATELAGSASRPAGGVSLFTFGSPRVGNPAFVEWASSVLGENTTRMVREGDIVPSMASEFFGYQHLPSEIWNRHRSNGTEWYVRCAPGGEDDRCHNSEWRLGGAEHLLYMGVPGGYCIGRDPKDNEKEDESFWDWLTRFGDPFAAPQHRRLRGTASI